LGLTEKADFTFKHSNYPDRPTDSAATVKSNFDSRAAELRAYLNDTLIPELTGYGATYAASAAGSDAYAVTLTNFPAAYTTGQRVTFKADVANTGACTLAINGLAAVAIKLDDGSDPGDGDIQAGAIVTVQHDGTNWQLVTPGLVRHKAETTQAHGGIVGDLGGVPTIQAGLDAGKPAAGTVGRLYIATDTQIIYQDTGTAWGKRGVVKWDDIDNKPASFSPATHGNEAHDPDLALASDLNTHLLDYAHHYARSFLMMGG